MQTLKQSHNYIRQSECLHAHIFYSFMFAYEKEDGWSTMVVFPYPNISFFKKIHVFLLFESNQFCV